MDQTSPLPNPLAPRPAGAAGYGAKAVPSAGAGAISGGLLRPGAIDQPQFKSMLQAAQAAQQTGASPPPQPSPASLIDGIPTLTPAQFAVLTGGQAMPESQNPGPNTVSNLVANPEAAGEIPIVGPAELVSGKPQVPTPAGTAEADAKSEEPAAAAPAKDDPAVDDPRVVHFKRMPDKDERKALMASGKRWVVDETPGSRKLFFGEDEVFGWDDLADLVNPLQHIPVVAQIYRAVSGDEINGAAEIMGSLPFGPTAFFSGVANVAVRDMTGKDIGSNLIAMMFGGNDTPAATGLAAAGDTKSPADVRQTSSIQQPPSTRQGDITGEAVETATIDVPAAATPGRKAERDNGGHDA